MGSKKKALKVLFIASEMSPIVKVGGLGDVVGSLPKAFFKHQVDIRVLLPRYKNLSLSFPRSTMGSIDCEFAGSTHRVRIYETFLRRKFKLPIYFLENNKYLSSGDRVHPRNKKENYQRFLFFSKAATCFLERWGFKPDIVHIHDWHTSFIPLLLKNSPDHYWDIVGLPKPKTIFTIHNYGYNPILPKAFLKKLDFLPPEFIDDAPKKVNLLKTAIEYADFVTTVSPTYKKELLMNNPSKEIQDMLTKKANSFFGILNGIDTSYWSIRNNKILAYNLKIATTSGIEKFKQANKNKLLEESNLKNDKPLFGFCGRLAEQKGLQILLPALESLFKKTKDFNFIFLGSGSKQIANDVEKLASKYPKNIFANLSYDENFAHLLYAGCDFIVIPSLYEPCGLVQMIAAIYTSIPIVRKTGGLADTIEDEKQGVVFDNFSQKDLLKALERALVLYKSKGKLLRVIKTNLKRDFSWQVGAVKYLTLYSQAQSVKKEDLE